MNQPQLQQDLDQQLDGGDHQTTTVGPGKSTLTSRLTPAAQIIFRVADPETARALGESLSSGGRHRIQREASGGHDARDGNGVAAGAEAAVERAASSSGAPLPTHLQRQFEGSLGADLSSVRVHTGGESAQASQAVGAKAYTVGSDIHFGEGRYQPDDPFGMHLLAHEVAHTVQQSGGAPTRQHKLEVSTPQDTAEHEADRAADAMVRGEAFSVGGGSGALSRVSAQVARDKDDVPDLYKFQLKDKPLPPGVLAHKTLSPMVAAVKAGENGDSTIPDPAGLFDSAEHNFTRFAKHATNVQAHYHARAGTVDVPLIGPMGGNHFFAEFAETAGRAHAFCENGAVQASSASAAIGMWIPALTSSQDRWRKAKQAAEDAGIPIASDKSGSSLDQESLDIEGQTHQGIVKNVLPQDPNLTKDKVTQDRIKKSNDEQLDAGKNVKSSEKVLLDEASTNFEQSMTEVTSARSDVVIKRGKAVASLSAAKVAANSERLKAAETDKAKIDEIFGLVDKAQGAIETGMGLVKQGEGMQLMSDGMGSAYQIKTDTDAGLQQMQATGESAMKIKASQVAKLILQLDGTIPTIEGEIAACKTADANLNGIIKAETIASDGKAYAAAIKRYRDALALVPPRMEKYASAHKAFAEAVNLALIKRGTIKPGGDGVAKTMALLGELRIAQAATASAIAATGDVSGSITAVAGMQEAPQPDVCELKQFLGNHARAFTSAPGHVAAILAVLTARDGKLKGYIEKLAV